MKKNLKGFTLIECLVALGILGIASLTMAQIYASVASRNRMNHLVNTSLSNQMAYVEKYTNSDRVEIEYGNGAAAATTKPPHLGAASTNGNYLEVRKKDSAGNVIDAYSFPVDVYVLKSRNAKNETLDRDKGDGTGTITDYGNTHGYVEADYNLRYKYILGHAS